MASRSFRFSTSVSHFLIVALVVLTWNSFVHGAPFVPISFSGGKSGITMFKTEREFYQYTIPSGTTIPDGTHACITHFWLTGGNYTYVDRAQIRIYLDGETKPSIFFEPALMAGVGFLEGNGPFGNQYFGRGLGKPTPGLGADVSGWYNYFRIPFTKSFRATVALPPDASGEGDCSVFILIRGSVGVPIMIGDFAVPTGARLVLQTKYNVVLKPLDYYYLIDIPKGSGLVFLTTLVVASGNANFMEGCFRAYIPYNTTFAQSILLATGTEDYYDSGYYFHKLNLFFKKKSF